MGPPSFDDFIKIHIYRLSTNLGFTSYRIPESALFNHHPQSTKDSLPVQIAMQGSMAYSSVMTIRPIVTYPERILHKTAREVVDIDRNIRMLAKDMLDTMYDAPGIGLAAPQIGAGLRVVVMDCTDTTEEKNPVVMVNPVIKMSGTEKEVSSEGCLSLPGINADIERSIDVDVSFVDLEGNAMESSFTGLWARCVQHEIDHLNGRLFTDHLSRLKRQILLRRFMREYYDGKKPVSTRSAKNT